ncbi:hypothetical protein CC117_29050 [Parafrankia colletiae]|uniref:LmbE-like protein n=1 Tax=Parafrankia colletiae TaxID=573497 RepID=A0A1S1Q778_9ACTN|nr:PIG-L deacetylase family protein [Parafrankia colletiae]MCK9903555.1 PIG-L family deacetylase [Frankia sp. Cpl3]OHV29446.1 hypothetical protein CC117_29050 [Parafrankia colletiae]
MSRVLVVAPHPDDEVLGCGGSIALHRRAGRTVGVLYLTSGEHASPTVPPEELGPIRETEAVAATGVLGVPADALTWLRFPDGGLDSRDPGQLGAVMAVLRRFRPTLLYLPHPGDGSFDHREAAALCLRAAGMAGSANFPEWGGRPWWVPTILGYEVWSPIVDPAYTEDITDALDVKVAALGCYRSQTQAAKGARQADYIGEPARYLAGYRGAMAGGGFREAFSVHRLGTASP